MNIAVDLGNSYAKCGLFEEDHLVELFDQISIPDLISLVNKKQPLNVILSSVNQKLEQIRESFEAEINCIEMNSLLTLPIKSVYSTPNTLGVDRIAAVAGANFLFSNRNILVIDAGTCITYDIINEKGIYQGGAISPGLNMKLKAIHNYTANLPLIELEEEAELVGNSTKKSILSGIINGTKAEIMQMIRMYALKFGDLQVVICGGDSKMVKKYLPNDVTLVAELVLIGLNRILNYHVKGI